MRESFLVMCPSQFGGDAAVNPQIFPLKDFRSLHLSYLQDRRWCMARVPCDTFLGTISLRKSLCLCIPLSPCCSPAPPADPQIPLKVAQKLAGRDHTVRLHGAGLPVRAAAGTVRRVLLGPGPFFGDIHSEGTGCSKPALHW